MALAYFTQLPILKQLDGGVGLLALGADQVQGQRLLLEREYISFDDSGTVKLGDFMNDLKTAITNRTTMFELRTNFWANSRKTSSWLVFSNGGCFYLIGECVDTEYYIWIGRADSLDHDLIISNFLPVAPDGSSQSESYSVSAEIYIECMSAIQRSESNLVREILPNDTPDELVELLSSEFDGFSLTIESRSNEVLSVQQTDWVAGESWWIYQVDQIAQLVTFESLNATQLYSQLSQDLRSRL